MSFFKLDNGTVLEAPNYVFGPGVTLVAENHSNHEYPVQGWYWFDTIEEAYSAFNIEPLVIDRVSTLETVVNRLPGVTDSQITKLQVKKQAQAMGIWEALKAAIAADADLNEDWELTNGVAKDHPAVLLMAAALNMTSADVDAFFAAANLL